MKASILCGALLLFPAVAAAYPYPSPSTTHVSDVLVRPGSSIAGPSEGVANPRPGTTHVSDVLVRPGPATEYGYNSLFNCSTGGAGDASLVVGAIGLGLLVLRRRER